MAGRGIEEFSTEDLISELDDRDKAKRRIVRKHGSCLVEDYLALAEAINQLNWGNIPLCAHYLIRTVPGLHKLGKVLGA